MAQATATDKGYRFKLDKPRDKQIRKPYATRNRWGRRIVFVACILLMFGIPTSLAWYLGSLLGHPVIGGLVGFLAGGYIASRLVPDRFLINNLEWTAFVTQDMFRGEMVPYGPGLHPSYPWEQHGREGNYPLKVITRPFEANVSTASSKVRISGEYEYAMSLRNITVAIGIDESTIQSGITAFIESSLIAECTGTNPDGTARDADWARSHVKELNKALADEFMNRESQGNSPDSFEARFGFVTVSIVISKIAFSDEVQRTRDSVDEAVTLHRVVAAMYGFTPAELTQKLTGNPPVISIKEYNAMLNRAMSTSGNATMDVKVIEADIPALITKLAQTFGGRQP